MASDRRAAVFERLTRGSGSLVDRGQLAAGRLGAEQVEPEHLLLAAASGCGDDPAARALAEAGLRPDAIAEAIEQDLVATLEIVGVPASVVASTPPRPSLHRPPFGLLATTALHRALQEAARRRDRRIGTEHVLLGLLRPPDATVSRLLARLDVDPVRLAALVQMEVAAESR